MKLGLLDRTTPEFSANVDYMNVCFVPKVEIQYYYLKNLSLKLEANKFIRTD